jgi:spectinomycin phosphotransferase
VKDPPRNFSTLHLIDALRMYWDLEPGAQEYIPVGFGAHHWRLTTTEGQYFLSLHDLDQIGWAAPDRAGKVRLLGQALGAAHWLESVAGLDFVLGPITENTGQVVRQVADQFALAIYPWLDVAPLEDIDGAQTAQLIARMHGATSDLPADLVRCEDFLIPHRSALEEALADLDHPWQTGPYAATPANEGPTIVARLRWKVFSAIAALRCSTTDRSAPAPRPAMTAARRRREWSSVRCRRIWPHGTFEVHVKMRFR